ncbi:FAD-dependent 5-carboxymethylaminomethyl-2-thiouridine(34) oxidoreductase MnmC [Pollutimonas sp. H1-120]|uniref:FAD-dependent 5-carboxymethylaminomethyl-2-thiouridine(34) oxidoreductase MnmC n=1 Tax=Pollutimonas sp. H1-120 TaxID=3148824 RepID=UPI003B51E3B9
MSSNYEPLIPARPAFDWRGILMSPDFGDIYHPEAGAMAQAEGVFVRGNDLPRRWQGRQAFTVCETGFGLGHNFLALWHCWRNDPRRPARLHFVSFEAHPFSRQDMAQLLARLPAAENALAKQLVAAWPPLLPGMHRLEFENGAVTLTLAFGPVMRLAKQVSAGVDAFFLDGFAPRVNPDMWSRPLFGQLARMANPGATVATWCCAGEMRRALRDAGFLVSKVQGFGSKREMTVAGLRTGMGRKEPAGGADGSVLVVGGGLAGAGVAQALALRGRQVTVLDPVLQAGLGASHHGHRAAGLSPVISPDDDIRARLSRAGVLRALQRWQELPGDARPLPCGTLEVVADPEDAARRRQALDALRFPEDWVCWQDAVQASERVGFPLHSGGLWFGKGQLVQPVPLLEALLSLPGVYCKARSAVFLRRNESGLWIALDAQGREIASAGNVVLANAAQAAELLARVPDLPPLSKLASMHRLAGQVAYFTGGAASGTRAIVAGDGYWLPAVQEQCTGGSTYVLGAAASTVTTQGRNEVASRISALLNIQSAQLGGPPGSFQGWAGWRAAVSDRLPVIGSIDGAPGLWLACAYGSRGLSWSALAGDIIAARLCNEPVPLERELLRKIAPR